jgi:metal-responsive CopG/Arc/MetJ family transcriptional regulator
MGYVMRTIQMTLEDDLVDDVDLVSKKLNINRSAFTRKALREALSRYKIEEMERAHSQGYKQHPVKAEEFSVWEDEQAWGDE